eukprot:CAMPEP_0197717716 /NCGR_PEP_ID=MMETSP1434-20131217/2159_1 /TAXON_ID=265543 /ORGANISM="Minutocellus polymorphus, Strain CCMP3303" /LENGTH=278 /DNA_ID=CAMNT_0043302283 /DNA_START=71 /DNA_END=907 /DNA_ORIENTATION=-
MSLSPPKDYYYSRRDDDEHDDEHASPTQAVVQTDESLDGGRGKASSEGGSSSPPSKDALGQNLLTTSLTSSTIACTTACTADDDDDDDDDEQTTCSSTRKALNDFHIRSTPPSPASRSGGSTVPSAFKEAIDTAATASATTPTVRRRQSSSSQSPKPVKRHSSILGAQPHPHNRLHRENFLIFTRILFKCLGDHPSPKVRVEAKRIIMDCTKRNRVGEPGYYPLVDAIEVRLRHVIGNIHWHKAYSYLDHYMTFRRNGGAGAPTNKTNQHGPKKDSPQ